MRVLHVVSEKSDHMAAGRAMSALVEKGIAQSLVAATTAVAALDVSLVNRLEVTPFRFKRRLFRSRRLRLASIIRQVAPDLIQYWCAEAAAAAPSQWRARSVLWLDRADGEQAHATCEWRIASTALMREQLLTMGAHPNRTLTIYNHLAPDKTLRAVDRALYDTPDDGFLAVSVGALADSSGFDTLIDATRRVERLHVWIVGAGPLQAALHAQCRASGLHDRVRFLPPATDVPGLLKAADVYVSLCHEDQFDPVIAGAFAYGVPVIATAAAAPGGEVRHGETGLITPKYQDEPLAARLQALMGEPEFRQSLIARGTAGHAALFSKKAFLDAYTDLMHQVIAYAGSYQR